LTDFQIYFTAAFCEKICSKMVTKHTTAP